MDLSGDLEEIKILDIIIPAYNCKDTLPRTLGSIVAQTKKEKCIVTVVDDCSTEDLRPIIDDFKKYIKINYIKLSENLKYPGLVRQIGLENSIAPFVMFLDSDDMLEPIAVEIMHNEMMKSDRDVIIGYFLRQDGKGNITQMTEKDTTWLHGNVYRRSFLKKSGIQFPTGYNEDGAFNTQCYMLSDKIGVLKKPVMYWMHNEKSITHSETYFFIRYADHLVSTLNFAYKNIFAHGGRTKKVIKNMGTHWALFLKMANDLTHIDEMEFRDIEARMNEELSKFAKDLDISHFTPEEKNYFKMGYTKGLQKYCVSKKPHFYEPDKFLDLYKLGISLSVNDFLFGGN